MKFAKCEMCGSTGLFMSHLKPKVKLFFHEFVLSHLSRLPIRPVFFRFRGCWVYSNSNRTFCKQTVGTLIVASEAGSALFACPKIWR